MSAIPPNSSVAVEPDLHDLSRQHGHTVVQASHLVEPLVTTAVTPPPSAAVCLSESIPSDSGTPSISFRKRTNADLIHTPVTAMLKNPALHSAEIDENLSPNCPSVSTSTPTSAATASSPRLSFKVSAEHVQSPLAVSDSPGSQILLKSGDAVSPCFSNVANRLARDSQPLSDYSGETAHASFATARAHSESPGESLIDEETSQRIFGPEFTTPSESFETYGGDQKPPYSDDLCQLCPFSFGEIPLQGQQQADQSIMGDVSMMSVDGNMSIDVRDDSHLAVEIATLTQNDPLRTEKVPVTGQLDIKVSSDVTNDGNLAFAEAAPVTGGRRTFNIDTGPAFVCSPGANEEVTDLASSKRSITPTATSDDVIQRSPPLAEHDSRAVPADTLNLAKVTEQSCGDSSAHNSRLNGTFDKTPNNSHLDLPASGDHLDVALSTSDHGSPVTKLNDTFDKEKPSLVTSNQPFESSTDNSVECTPSSNLNNTFDKSPSEESHHNDTFEKDSSTIVGAADYSELSKTPDLILQLDQTCQGEESVHLTREHEGRVEREQDKAPADKKDFLRTPDKIDVSRSQSTPRVARSKITVSSDNDDALPEQGDNEGQGPEKDDNAKPREGRRSSGGSFLKRRCSILELSFVSSPKRGNFEHNMPKGARGNGRTSLMQHESIAFDFSSAAATALDNNGVAEMGSFVFSSSSGQPVAADVFDLSALEKIDTSAKTNGEKYTRVSFIAMFDPIKPASPTQNKPEGKRLTIPSGKKSTDCTDFKTPMAHTEHASISPLVKGLPTPFFARPKSVNHVSVQTDLVIEEKPVTPELKSPEIDYHELTERITELNATVEKQRAALATYEKVMTVLRDRLNDKAKNNSPRGVDDSEDVARLKAKLEAERGRNAQQDDVVRNLERSMHATLKRMAECRESNAALAKVVDEQLAAMTLTRANCDALEHNRDEVVADAKYEVEALKAKALDDERGQKKALNMLDLQLKAKESELESSHSQLAIARKEIDSLRALVQQMNLQ